MIKRKYFIFAISTILVVAFTALISSNRSLASTVNSGEVITTSEKAGSKLAELKSTCGPGKPPFYGCPAYIFNAKPDSHSTSPSSERVCGPGQPPFYGCPTYIFNAKPDSHSTSPSSERVCGPGQPPFYSCPAYIFNVQPRSNSSLADSDGE